MIERGDGNVLGRSMTANPSDHIWHLPLAPMSARRPFHRVLIGRHLETLEPQLAGAVDDLVSQFHRG